MILVDLYACWWWLADVYVVTMRIWAIWYPVAHDGSWWKRNAVATEMIHTAVLDIAIHKIRSRFWRNTVIFSNRCCCIGLDAFWGYERFSAIRDSCSFSESYATSVWTVRPSTLDLLDVMYYGPSDEFDVGTNLWRNEHNEHMGFYVHCMYFYT